MPKLKIFLIFALFLCGVVVSAFFPDALRFSGGQHFAPCVEVVRLNSHPSLDLFATDENGDFSIFHSFSNSSSTAHYSFDYLTDGLNQFQFTIDKADPQKGIFSCPVLNLILFSSRMRVFLKICVIKNGFWISKRKRFFTNFIFVFWVVNWVFQKGFYSSFVFIFENRE